MNITDIRIRRTYCENRLRALVSITIDHDLALHDIKIIQGADRLFVAMPSRRDENGEFREHLPSHHLAGKTATGRSGAGLLPTVSATAGSCRLKSSRLGKIGVADFYLSRSTLLRVENRSRVLRLFIFCP